MPTTPSEYKLLPPKRVQVTIRKYEGDDLYSWAVFRSDQIGPVVTGLSKREAQYHQGVIKDIITMRGGTTN